MSQPFRITNSDARTYARLDSHTCHQLMAFSYFNNDHALLLMALLGNKEVKEAVGAEEIIGSVDWSGDRIVQAGSYGDKRRFLSKDDIQKVDAIRQQEDWYSKNGRDENGNPKVNLDDAAHYLKWENVLNTGSVRSRLVEDPCGDGEWELSQTIYDRFLSVKEKAYAVNLSDDTYVDLGRYAKEHAYQDVMIDPLLLLLANGNGRGGGDYHGCNEDLVGAWAGSQITMTLKPPTGFSELRVLFHEGGDHPLMLRISRPDSMDFRA